MAPSLQKGIDSAKQGQMDLALSYLKDAIIEEPENANVWVWLAAIIEDEAKQTIFLTKALQIDPDNRPAQRGMAYIERKKTVPPRPGEKLSDHTKPIGLFGKDAQSPTKYSASEGIPHGVETPVPERTTPDTASPDLAHKREQSKSRPKAEKRDKTALLDIFLYIFILLVFIFIGILVGSTLLKIDLPFITPVAKTIDLPALPPSDGLYLYDGSVYALIQKHAGAPEYEEGIPVTNNPLPYVLIQKDDSSTSLLTFQYEDGSLINHSVNPVNTQASLLIPEDTLHTGLYCLIGSNSDPSQLPDYWCFRIK